MKSDHREFTRLDASLRVEYRILESLGEHEATDTRDVSEKGIRIPLSENLDPGTRLEIALSLPNEDEPIRAIGRVVWSRFHADKDLHEAGIHLVHIKQTDRARLYKLALL